MIDHELVMVANVDHVLICRIYQLIPQVSIAAFRSKLIVHVANNIQLVGESKVGMVGGVVSTSMVIALQVVTKLPPKSVTYHVYL